MNASGTTHDSISATFEGQQLGNIERQGRRKPTERKNIKCSSTSRPRPPKRTPSFPLQLLTMLNDAEEEAFTCIVSWLPDGKSFMVKDEIAITAILPRYFKQTHYKSFVRQLQIYGVERICRGPHKGEYKHPLIFKGQTKSSLSNLSIEDYQMEPALSVPLTKDETSDGLLDDIRTTLHHLNQYCSPSFMTNHLKNLPVVSSMHDEGGLQARPLAFNTSSATDNDILLPQQDPLAVSGGSLCDDNSDLMHELLGIIGQEGNDKADCDQHFNAISFEGRQFFLIPDDTQCKISF